MVFENLKVAFLGILTHTSFISRKVGFSRRCKTSQVSSVSFHRGSIRRGQPRTSAGGSRSYSGNLYFGLLVFKPEDVYILAVDLSPLLFPSPPGFELHQVAPSQYFRCRRILIYFLGFLIAGFLVDLLYSL